MNEQFLTVSALTQYIKLKFDKDKLLKAVPLRGELAEIAHKKGHYYFKIKDEQSIISCVMFKQYVTPDLMDLTKGMEIEVIGDVSVYPVSGSYQIYVTSITQSGVGMAHKQFERLKQELQEQGYFDSKHKKAIPSFSQKVALVTAKGSAALHDMLITLQKRYPLSEPLFFYAAVQGKFATQEIITQLQQADASDADVIVLARGGGSYEDLQAFNDKDVVQMIFELTKPIVTGIGHEIDVTIADLVADVRAATPTAAIEYVTPDKTELLITLQQQQQVIQRIITKLFRQKQLEITQGQKLLQSYHPQTILQRYQKDLQIAYERISSNVLSENIITNRLDDVTVKMKQLVQSQIANLDKNRQRLDKEQKILETLSPYQVFARGYSIASKDDKLISSVTQVETTDHLDIQFIDGQIVCEVKEINNG